MIATLDPWNAFRRRRVEIFERPTFRNEISWFFSVLPGQRTSKQVNYFKCSTRWTN